MNLNGLWDVAVVSKNDEAHPQQFKGKILVPYPIESALSGVMKPLLPDQRLWYHRTFGIPDSWRAGRILLHFEAVDWETRVYLNGRDLGAHRGGYDSFTYDITGLVTAGESQDLMVSVWDPSDKSWQLRGKQVLNPRGSWFGASSGIWQSVWLEPVPASYVDKLTLVPDTAAGLLHLTVEGRISPEPMVIEATAWDGATNVSSATVEIGTELTAEVRKNLVDFYKATLTWASANVELPIKGPKLWSPETPFLYDLVVVLKKKDGTVVDTVGSYFGMRSVSKQPDPRGFTRFLLNGKPMRLSGALVQAWWPDGLVTAPCDEALRHDIQIAKRAGLNAIREHVKVECERFYYWCDKLGLMVLQDMPSGGEGDPKTDLPTSPEAAAQCEQEKRTLIQSRWNHPSIIAWCPFNEGWGQHDTLRFARWIKELDPSRLVDEASGFPWHGGGDIQDNHGGVSRPNANKIGIVSENGGFGLATPGHDWPCEIWTYHTYDPATSGTVDAMAKKIVGKQLPALNEKSKAWFTRQVVQLFAEMWNTPGMFGQFYCQLYDTESECDGLVSYDRAVWKVDAEAVSKAARGEATLADKK